MTDIIQRCKIGIPIAVEVDQEEDNSYTCSLWDGDFEIACVKASSMEAIESAAVESLEKWLEINGGGYLTFDLLPGESPSSFVVKLGEDYGS